MATALTPPSRWGVAVLLLLGLATWSLSHGYLGIFHDAALYTLQALARLHPESLPDDIFLKLGSQDHMTVWSPLFAVAVHVFGLEAAAALLTVASQAALLAAAWSLARRAAPAATALLGVGVLLAVPANYGADRVFACLEPFLTPRMAAAALVLASLAAALSERRAVAVILTLAAMLLHPLMGLAGVCALLVFYGGYARPVLTGALAAVTLKALVLAAFFMPAGPWGRFDAAWFGLVERRSPYLFLTRWPLEDWASVAVTLATLTVGATLADAELAAATPAPGAAPPGLRKLCRVSLITVAGGLLLTLIGADWLHVVLVTQLQPWRWTWLGVAVAALLLPEIVRRRWSLGPPGRTVAVLLLAGWLFNGSGYALTAAAGAVAAVTLLPKRTPDEVRWIWFGSCGLLCIALAWRLASDLTFTDAYFLAASIPLGMRRAASAVHSGMLPAALMALVVWLSQAPRGRLARASLALLGVCAAAVCIALLPQTWRSLSVHEFPAQRIAEFAPLRARIPPHAEVFWPESPLGVWTLLERPSFISATQTSGMVFSRPTAVELERRAAALASSISPVNFMDWSAGVAVTLSRQQLLDACKTGAFAFLVTSGDLGVPPLAAVAPSSGAGHRLTRLYRCPAAAAAAAT